MKQLLWPALLFVVVGLAGTVANAQNAPPASAWCKTDGKIPQGSLSGFEHDDPGDQLAAIAYLKCNPKYVENADLKPIDEAFQKLSARFELDDAGWADVVAYTQAGIGTRRGMELRPTDDKHAWSSLEPIEQYATIEHPRLEVPGLMGETDQTYVVDALGAKLSEIGRLAYLAHCLRDAAKPVEWAICQGDLDAFDPKKVLAELRADKTHGGYERITIKLVLDDVKSKLPGRADAIKKLVAKDPAYGKLFEIASKQRKDWDARWKSNTAAVELALAMDDAMVTSSRKATAGCHEKTWATLKTAIGKLPAKSFVTKRQPDRDYQFVDDVLSNVAGVLVGDPDSYLASDALAMCEKFDPPKTGKDRLGMQLGGFMDRWPGFRGPRNASHSMILKAGIELDDRNAQLEYPDLQRFWFKSPNEGGGVNGVISSVKISGDTAKIEFAPKPEQEVVDTGCKQTNRVQAIRSDGTLVYDVTCTGTKTVTYDHRPSPQTVQARYAQGLKPGMVVAIQKDVVWAAWPKAGATVPSIVLGVAVK